MSTMFSSSSGLNKSEITVTSTNQILSGYKDYDSNGNLLTGSNAGYDAGVTQGEANMKSGVTVTDASHIISGYKARTSNGTLVTGNNAGYTSGYNAGVTKGESNMKSGVTVTAASQVLSGYKARTSNGALVTGTNGGWDAGRTQGQADMKSGVTVTDASQIVNGYKARNSSGTLLTGNATVGRPVSAAYITEVSGGGGSALTFSATVGAIYAVAWGGRAGDTPSTLSGSGFNQLAFKCGKHTSSGQPYGVTIGIIQATATTVSVQPNMNFPATGHGVVMRVTN